MRSFVNYFVYFVFLRLVECGIVGVDGCKSGVPVHENEEFDPSEICVPAVTTPTKKCMPENFDALKIQKLVESHQSKHLLPLLCKSPQDNYKIGIGLVYIKSSYPEVALDHFTKLIMNRNDEICRAFYFMRALAFTKLGLDDPRNAQNAISDLTEALQAAEQKDRLKIYETRAQVNACQHQ
uniref:Uncharacterized protein n=1 Tax=Ciona savignyi TaxID=51511 RepID=H2ZPH9_CIOSA